MDKITLLDKFDLIHDHWRPRVVGELNGQHVRISKVLGEFIWHRHDDADELFFVVRGSLTIRLRDREVVLNEGDLFIVPRGVEHQPVAEREAWLMLFEPAETLNTGEQRNERTIERLERI